MIEKQDRAQQIFECTRDECDRKVTISLNCSLQDIVVLCYCTDEYPTMKPIEGDPEP